MIRVSISILAVGIICLLFLLLCLAIYLVVQRQAETKRHKAINDYILTEEKHWYAYLTGEVELSKKLIPKSAYEREAIEEIFLVYMKNLSNSFIKERITSYAGKYLASYYKQQLKSFRSSMRLNALYRILEFDLMNELSEQLKQFKNRRLTREEQFQFLKIELQITSGHRFIENMLSMETVFSEHEYRQLFLNADSDVLENAMEQFESLSSLCKWALIDAMGFNREIVVLSFLESLLDHREAELRIKALKAIYRIGVVLELERYLVFVTSTMWEERLMIAKIMENVPLEDSILHLQKLAQDESWWVRSQAIASIGEQKEYMENDNNKAVQDSWAAENKMGEALF